MADGVIFTSLVILDLWRIMCNWQDSYHRQKHNLLKQFLGLIAIFQNISNFLKHYYNFIFKIFPQPIFFTLLFLHSYWLYSPHFTFHNCGSLILQLEICNSYISLTYFFPLPCPSPLYLFVLCFCFIMLVHLFGFLGSTCKWSHTAVVILWLISLSIVSSSFNQVFANAKIPFFSINECTWHVCRIFLIHSSIDRHLDCLHVLTIVILLQWTYGCFHFLLIIPRTGTAGSYGSSLFNFLRILHTFFHRGCTIHIPTNRAQEFPFFSILANTCYLLSFFIIAILTSVRWYLIFVWFAFLWWLVMLSMFSCWPSVCLLWK